MSEPDRVDQIQSQWRRERPDVDVSPMALVGRIHRLGDRLRDELIAVYRRFGLNEGEFDLLATLRRAGSPFESAPGELARHTMVTTGAVSKRLDRLEAAGLVRRRESEVDGRGRIVVLTDAGRRTIDEAFAAHMRNEARLVESLTPEQRAQLEPLLRTWLSEFEEDAGSGATPRSHLSLGDSSQAPTNPESA